MKTDTKINRRAFSSGAFLMALGACTNPAPLARGLRAPAPDPQFPSAPDPGWDAWVAGFRPRALSGGIPAQTFDGAFRHAGFLPGVIERDRNQTESTRSLEDYLSIAASDERVAQGRAALSGHRALFDAIEARHGVEPKIVAAIWGLESFYGTRRGSVPVISALSTLAYEGRRGAFFESQLTAALKILQNGDTTPDAMTGSWAGAMGHTQFIPTTYLAYAVDFRGDGRRDIWGEDPTDALASAAAYLARMGWKRGQPWGIEVRLPEGFAGPFGRGTARPVSQWAAAGVRTIEGVTPPDHGAASILIPAGRSGPAFMVFANFGVIARYNNSESYVIGVGHLADRLAGGGPIRGTFPPDASGLSKADRQELQRRVTAQGFDTEGSDGVIGPKTQAAIRAFERARGMPQTGQPSPALLEILRRVA